MKSEKTKISWGHSRPHVTNLHVSEFDLARPRDLLSDHKQMKMKTMQLRLIASVSLA